jgi:hypothetical protein
MAEKQSRIARLKDLVAEALEAKNRATFPVPYHGKMHDFVRFEVPIEFPLYNVKSGRTHRAQSRYVDKKSLPADFFEDPEEPQVQQAQNEILLEMVDQEGLAADLREKQQKNPLVLTYDGYVVDGNRRLAALRRDKETDYVHAVRLPQAATDQEIYETELELQMSRETKAEYNWIDEALHVRYGVNKLYERGRDALVAVAKRMNLDEKEIRGILNLLDLVDLYLAWRGDPQKYHLVPESTGGTMKQAFEELAQRVTQKEYKVLSPDQRKLLLYGCFAVIESRGGYKDVRRVWARMIEEPTRFMNRVRSETPKEVAEQVEHEQPRAPVGGRGSSLIKELATAEGEGPKPNPHAVALVSASAVGSDVGQVLREVAIDMEAEAREDEKHSEPKERVERALHYLEQVRLTKSTKHIEQISKDLGRINKLVDRLAGEIGKLRSERD